jgi:hypothetical protein
VAGSRREYLAGDKLTVSIFRRDVMPGNFLLTDPFEEGEPPSEPVGWPASWHRASNPPGFNPGNYQVRRFALNGREITIG